MKSTNNKIDQEKTQIIKLSKKKQPLQLIKYKELDRIYAAKQMNIATETLSASVEE